jgi:hypothetical protein
VIFDYLGAGTELPTGLRPAPEDVDGASGAPHVWGDRTLLVACRVADGELRLRFGYDERTYRSSTVDSVAEDTMAVLRTLAHPGI